jgi:hypothetical protein
LVDNEARYIGTEKVRHARYDYEKSLAIRAALKIYCKKTENENQCIF